MQNSQNKSINMFKTIALAVLATIIASIVMLATGCGADNTNNNSNNNNTANQIEITINKLDETEPYKLKIDEGTTINGLKPQLAVEGYDLNGLYQDEGCENQYTDTYVLQNGDTVYCKYEIKHFTITMPTSEDWYEIQTEDETTNVAYGTEFKFSLTLDPSVTEEVVTVTANNDPLTKGQDGYTIIIKADTTINVQIETYTITFPEQVTVTYNEQLQTGATVRYGATITVSYTKKEGYTQTVNVNGVAQEEPSQDYIVTKEITIDYDEKLATYSVTVNEEDKVIITLKDGIDLNKLHFGNVLEIKLNPANEVPENYNQILDVAGATKQEDGSYKVTGNVIVTYLEVDKQLSFTYNEESGCYDVRSANNNISGKIVFPSRYSDGINGVHNVEIPSSSCHYANKITEVVVSEGITKIGSGAFYGCEGLEKVTLPDSLTTIEKKAFAGCTHLFSIILPKNLTTIEGSVSSDGREDERAFLNCEDLFEVINKSSLPLVKGDDGYGGVAKFAFVLEKDESKQGEIKYYNKIKYYENTKVQVNGHRVLAALDYADRNHMQSVLNFEADTLAIGCEAFTNYTGNYMDSLTLPEGLLRINSRAFHLILKYGNISLVLPKSLIYIGINAFGECYGIKSLTVQSDIKDCDFSIFQNCTITEVIVNDANIYKAITDQFAVCYLFVYGIQTNTIKIKVLKEIVDNVVDNPMPNYLAQNFDKNNDPENEEYYIFTLKAN